MRIDERIFREIEPVDFSDPAFYEDNYNLLYSLAEKEAYTDDEKTIEEALTSIISVYRIHLDSLLYQGLLEWYKGFNNLEENIRACTLDGDYIYFVTGCGYDIISNDLLGGSADGKAKKDFIEFLNTK